MREPVPSTQRQKLNALELAKEREAAGYHEETDDEQQALELEQEQDMDMDKDSEAMLTLPEFVKEPMPAYFVEQAKKVKRRSAASSSAVPYVDNFEDDTYVVPLSRTSSSGKDDTKKEKKDKSRSGSKEKEKRRSRSVSAPPLRFPWLKSSLSTSGLGVATSEGKENEKKGKTRVQGLIKSYQRPRALISLFKF